jgi:hypothetical protein
MMRDEKESMMPATIGFSTEAPRQSHLVRLVEARGVLVAENGAGTISAILLSEGAGNRRDLNFYGPEAVRSAVRAFAGRPAFLDHPSRSEDQERPERSVKDLAGRWRNLRLIDVQGDDGRRVSACAGDLILWCRASTGSSTANASSYFPVQK